MWIGGFLIVGAAAHAAIFMVRDYDPTTRYNDLLDRVLRHRDAIISHLNWACIFLGFHSFGLYIHNDTMSALGRPQDMFSDTAIQLQPVFAQWIQNTHALAPGATAPGATASTSLTWGGGDLVAVGGKVALLPIPLGTADFLVHHIHAFTIHVTVLILLKGVLFARSSRLIPDKANLGFRFPCDGPGRGGTCQVSAWDHVFLGLFWMYNSISSSITINGWLRDFLWAQASQVIQSYGSSLSAWPFFPRLATLTTEMETERFVVQKCRISSESSFVRTLRLAMEWKELLSLAGNRSCALLSLSLSPLSQKQWKAFGASLVLSSPLSLVNLNWNCATFRDCWSYKKFPSKTDISREECQFEERASFGPVLVNGLGRFMILDNLNLSRRPTFIYQSRSFRGWYGRRRLNGLAYADEIKKRACSALTSNWVKRMESPFKVFVSTLEQTNTVHMVLEHPRPSKITRFTSCSLSKLNQQAASVSVDKERIALVSFPIKRPSLSPADAKLIIELEEFFLSDSMLPYAIKSRTISFRCKSHIRGGEGIPAATVGVDGPSSVTVRAVAGISSASDLTVGGRTAVRNVHVEAPISCIDEALGILSVSEVGGGSSIGESTDIASRADSISVGGQEEGEQLQQLALL
ncbi:UNVERIFIED_CONTAM: Photosystem I chlorophyll a apoprotein A1 [Sesamum calycinum]|uniref:photosystem I n=1 Tax=Sesamum calycinum TaxID=2727403 RepID=A0AAW2IZE1_9LAMI